MKKYGNPIAKNLNKINRPKTFRRDTDYNRKRDKMDKFNYEEYE